MENKKPRIGKYILDSLSIGMYNHPLMLIREYIQNSTDAIDELKRTEAANTNRTKINIYLDGKEKKLIIKDNGIGISVEKAKEILHDIGKSNKKLTQNRGFRGIGRLGGLGYCKFLKFTTKAKGENYTSTSTWDCDSLRDIIRKDNNIETAEIIQEITKFTQNRYDGDPKDHFFIVEMINLQSSRDVLLNVPIVRSYVAEVAPVPFNSNIFSYANQIEVSLAENVPKYNTYNIFINNEKIHKPYQDTIIVRGDKKERIKGIDFFKIENLFSKLGFCWIARTDLSGSINNKCLMDGIRVRCGNMLIGNNYLLDEFFREKRFNRYLLGELHVIHNKLIPNSRRDDFEDNEVRENFYDSFIKTIGLPFSKKIREASIERTKNRQLTIEKNLHENSSYMIKNGYFSESYKGQLINEIDKLKKNNNNKDKKEDFDNLLYKLRNTKNFFEVQNNNMSNKTKILLRSLYTILSKESLDIEKKERIMRTTVEILHNNLF